MMIPMLLIIISFNMMTIIIIIMIIITIIFPCPNLPTSKQADEVPTL